MVFLGGSLGYGWESVKRTHAAAGALFSRVQGIKLGPFFATFSRNLSGAAFGRSLVHVLVDFRVQVVPKGTSLAPFGRTCFEHFLAGIQATDWQPQRSPSGHEAGKVPTDLRRPRRKFSYRYINTYRPVVQNRSVSQGNGLIICG